MKSKNQVANAETNDQNVSGWSSILEQRNKNRPTSGEICRRAYPMVQGIATRRSASFNRIAPAPSGSVVPWYFKRAETDTNGPKDSEVLYVF